MAIEGWIHVLRVAGPVPSARLPLTTDHLAALGRGVADFVLQGFPGGGALNLDEQEFLLQVVIGVEEHLDDATRTRSALASYQFLADQGVSTADLQWSVATEPPLADGAPGTI